MDYYKLCARMTEHEPLSRHTTLGIGGPADYFAQPQTAGELAALLTACPGAPVLGNGSNILAPDEGVAGLVIHTGLLRSLVRIDQTHIRAESGALLPALASFAWRLGLSGLEFAAGIPGSVGGAVVMNAGAYDGEISRCVVETEYWSGGTHTEHEHRFSYRRSVYGDHPERVVTAVLLKLTPDDPEAIRERMDELNARRRDKQPLEWPSAGSAFKRPPGHYAAELIDRCGLKGYQVGGAAVSEKHAGFVINRGGATCGDVLRLIEHIQTAVLQATGVSLEPEIKRLTASAL